MTLLISAGFPAGPKGHDASVLVTYTFAGTCETDRLFLDVKTRSVQLLMEWFNEDSLCPREHHLGLLTLGVACGELLAIVQQAKSLCEPPHERHGAVAELQAAETMLRQAHMRMMLYFTSRRFLVVQMSSERDPSRPWWRISPHQLALDWNVIGLPNYVSVE